MDTVGLFSLGLFVGAIATVGLKFIKDANTWKQGLATMISATLSGTATLFVQGFKNSHALWAYPIGLLVSLFWAYIYVASENIASKDSSRRWLGVCHLIGVGLATLVAVGIVLSSSVRKFLGVVD